VRRACAVASISDISARMTTQPCRSWSDDSRGHHTSAGLQQCTRCAATPSWASSHHHLGPELRLSRRVRFDVFRTTFSTRHSNERDTCQRPCMLCFVTAYAMRMRRAKRTVSLLMNHTTHTHTTHPRKDICGTLVTRQSRTSPAYQPPISYDRALTKREPHTQIERDREENGRRQSHLHTHVLCTCARTHTRMHTHTHTHTHSGQAFEKLRQARRTSTSRCVRTCCHLRRACEHCQMLLCIERCVGELESLYSRKLHSSAATRAPPVPTE